MSRSKTHRLLAIVGIVATGGLALSAVSGLSACVQLMGIGDNYSLEDDAATNDDGGIDMPDGTVNKPDANAADASKDGALDGGDSGKPVYLDWSDAGVWTVYQSPPEMGSAYLGGAFDGRYVYFTPIDHTSKVVRYDTTLPFAASGSWSAFDAPGLLGTQGFYGAAFDGRYVYFAGGNGLSGTPNLSARFDTKAGGGFAVAASWEKFNTLMLSDAGADAGDGGDGGDGGGEAGTYVGDQGFGGVFYDGTRYVYLVPSGIGSGATQGRVTRFDADGGFPDASAWSTFDLQMNVDPALAGLAGGYFDGRYAYFMPQAGTKAARYDSTLGFQDGGSWTAYQVATDGGQYLGVGADGTHVIASPNLATSPVEKYAPGAVAFSDASSWSAQPLASTTGTYEGMAFDGRYLYVVPYAQTNLMQRLDTQADGGGAWVTQDLSKVSVDAGDAGSALLAGGVFDGEYLYFPTWGAGIPAVVRLQTQAVRAPLPKLLVGGSFL